MSNVLNPWESVAPSTMRRINEATERNLFWIRDANGDYGFFVQSGTPFSDPSRVIQLRGIDVIKKNETNGSELYIILRVADDWELFLTVCKDLIAHALESQNDSTMAEKVEERLNRWQKLLSLAKNKLTAEIQMGLFAELRALQDILVPRLGLGQAVRSWVGPDSDRQDFLLDSAALEVKCYKATKGDCVTISSAHQLTSDKTHLYLVAYSVTPSEKGLSIASLAEYINTELECHGLNEEKVDFEDKLARFGYFFKLPRENLSTFLIDTLKSFEVRDGFPRLVPSQVASEIISVKYVLDLSRCREFSVPVSDLEL
jgi:hypothetical protein